MESSSEKERFIGIIKDNRRILYKVISSYCSDPEDRKDLEQEILIQLWRSLKHFNGISKLSTWIYRVALNVALSFYRDDSKRRTKTTSMDESIFQLAADDDYANEELNRRTELLHKFISKLDPFSKAVIILHLEDNSYKEISEILGITESNVGTKINRIKKKLKDYFTLVNN